MRKKLALIAPKGISSGVLQSQIEGLKKFYSQEFNITICIHKNDYHKLANSDNVFVYTSYARLIKGLVAFDNIYIRGWNDYFRLVLLRFFGVSIIYDFRGLASFESFYKNRNRLSFFILYFLECFIYLTASRVQVVSHSLKEHLYRYYKFRRQVTIVPCLVDTCRKPDNINDNRLNFIYIGGLSKWQCIDKVILWFEYFEKNLDNSCFTFVTKDKLKLKEYLSKSSLVNYSLLSGNREFVQNILKEQDFGIIIREDIVLNNVASPIKILEYASNGVVPLMTKNIGDYSSLFFKKRLAVNLNEEKTRVLEDILSFSLNIKDKRSSLDSLISSNLTWSSYDEGRYMQMIKSKNR